MTKKEKRELTGVFCNCTANADGSFTYTFRIDSGQIAPKDRNPLLCNAMMGFAFLADPNAAKDVAGQVVLRDEGHHIEAVGESKGYVTRTDEKIKATFKTRDQNTSIDALLPLRDMAGVLTLKYQGTPDERRGRPVAEVDGQQTIEDTDEL